MMQLNYLKSAALISVTAAATMLVIHGCGGGSAAIAQSAADTDPIEGLWESSITLTDCANNAVLRTAKGIGLFHRGGSLTADNTLPRVTQSLALGNWKRDAALAYTVNFRFYRFNADSSLAGSQRVQRAITLAADSKSFTGTITAQVIDPAEVVLQSTCGRETAVRIY